MPHKIFAGILVWLLIAIAPLTIAATKARAGDPLFILYEKILASDADPSAELGYSLILSSTLHINKLITNSSKQMFDLSWRD